MNNSEKQVTDFLLEEKNFPLMLNIAERCESIKRNLVIEFWHLVSEELVRLFKKGGGYWKVELTDDDDMFTKNYSWLSIYKKKWKETNEWSEPISVMFSDLYKDLHYGVWVYEDSKKFNTKLLRNYFVDKEDYKDEYTVGVKWWALKNNYSLNLSNNNDLIKILPSKRSSLIKNCAKTLFDLTIELEPHLDKMYKLGKK